MESLTGLVCLDGANATGKTTLAEELKRRHGAVILHQTYRFKDKIFDYHTAVLRRALTLAQTRLVVLDRLWMSEVVYATLYRGGTPWPHQGRMVDRVLMKACAVQVVCADRCRDQLMSRYLQTRTHRTDIDAERNADANDLYLWAAYGSGSGSELAVSTYLGDLAGLAARQDRFDLLVHEPYDGRVEETCAEIETRLRMRQETQLKGALTNDNYLGHIGPATRFLMVGDALNPKHRWGWPFFEHGNCSLWLAEQLHQLKFNETSAIWINAHDQPDTLSQLVEEQPELLGRVAVVALGRLASTKLESHGVAHAIVPHPQWGRRFDATGRRYRQELRTVLSPYHPTPLAPDQRTA